MALKRIDSSIDVIDAAKIRIKNIFSNGLKVYVSFSGGKDSLVLADLVIKGIMAGEINPAQVIVQFIDEEAIYPCIEEITKEYRKKFLMLGAQFEWYCIEVRHYNCFNSLENDESYICWDSQKENVWVRRPPSFAIRNHPQLKRRVDTYQDFCHRRNLDGITITGVRAAESLQRLQFLSKLFAMGYYITGTNMAYPVYDMKDSDVWLYLYENDIEIPEVYLFLWQIGTRKSQLRISQFFSIDTARSLVSMNEYYPDLMEKIIRREPNAYLASLYWDSEMFGRSSAKRRQLEEGVKKDYKAEVLKMFQKPELYFTTEHKRKVARNYKNLLINISTFATEKDFKELYESLVKGDPKLRTFRAVYQRVYTRYMDVAKVEEGNSVAVQTGVTNK